MADPTITSAAFRKQAYAVGEQIFLDIVYADTDRKVLIASIKVADMEGNESAVATATCVVDKGSLTVTSNIAGKNFVLVSDNGTNATYTITL